MTSRLHKVNAQSVFSSQVPLDKVTVDFRLWAAPLQDLTSKSPTNAPPPECPPPPRRHDGTSSWNFETQLPMAFASPLGPRSFGEVAAAIVLYNAADRTSYTTAMACVKAARDAAARPAQRLMLEARPEVISALRDLPGALEEYAALAGHALELRSVAQGPPQLREVPRD
jgi:hypothetical protein